MADIEDRFWSKVDKSGDCWVWTGARFNVGYGMFLWEGKLTGAHRVAWILTNGPITGGLWVLHHCDNRPCVRPDHLHLGTPKDNMRDATTRHRLLTGDVHRQRHRTDRQPRGELNGMTRLTPDRVRAIRAEMASGRTGAQVAAAFGICESTVYNIQHRRTWGHVS